jgi:hypothetical protein
MKVALLKIAALFSSCGGPLFVFGLLKPRLGVGPAFFIIYLPVALMLIGALCLEDAPSRWPLAAVRAGRQALYVVLGMHLYALWCFANGVRVSEQYLYYFGIAVGAVWSIAYLREARRWESSPGRTAMESIEPS